VAVREIVSVHELGQVFRASPITTNG